MRPAAADAWFGDAAQRRRKADGAQPLAPDAQPWQTDPMLGWLVRFALFKFLPRRIIPLITVIEIARLLWGVRRRQFGVNEPWRSRTAPPPRGWSQAQSQPPRRR